MSSMIASTPLAPAPPSPPQALAQQLYSAHRQTIYKRTDRMFAVLMVAQCDLAHLAEAKSQENPASASRCAAMGDLATESAMPLSEWALRVVSSALRGKGTHFDPAIVEAFVAVEKQFIEVQKRFAHESPEAGMPPETRTRPAKQAELAAVPA